MKIQPTSIAGVATVETSRRADSRGTFARFFCASELGSLMGQRHIVQINHSSTKVPGSVRGMHYQLPPFAEMKLVRCLKGSVWDVALDLRQGSPTFLEWCAETLSAENGKMMVIPEGCAHGFQTLQADCELLYLHTEFYRPDAEAGVMPTDPRVRIEWPLEITALSDNDATRPLLEQDFRGVAF